MLDQRRRHTVRTLVVAASLAAAVLAAPLGEAAAQSQGLKYTIMVSEFENRSGFAGWLRLSGAWGTILTDLLNRSGRFIVVGESDMRQEAMEEQALAASGVTAQGRKAPARGQMTPAQLLVKGVITDFRHSASKDDGALSFRGIGVGKKKETAEISATLYVVDSSTGMVVASTSVVGEANDKKTSFSIRKGGLSGRQTSEESESVKEAMADALDQGVEWMVGQLDSIPWRGSVVLVEGDRIYIDRGSREGVSQGMTLAVGESKVIRSPDTGEILDEIVTERARIEIVGVRDKTSTCKVVSGDASTIYEGMGVSPITL